MGAELHVYGRNTPIYTFDIFEHNGDSPNCCLLTLLEAAKNGEYVSEIRLVNPRIVFWNQN